MKVIDIPEPVTVTLSKMKAGEIMEETEEITFTNWLTLCLDAYGDLAKTPKMIRQYDQIMTVIEAVNGEKHIKFGPGDFDVVKDAVHKRNWGSPKLGRKYLPFYKAMDDAQDVKDSPAKEAEKKKG